MATEVSTARKVILEELQKVKNRRDNAKVQGLAPSEVRLTIEEGISLWEAMLIMVTHYDHHHHDVTINKQDRETGGPR